MHPALEMTKSEEVQRDRDFPLSTNIEVKLQDLEKSKREAMRERICRRIQALDILADLEESKEENTLADKMEALTVEDEEATSLEKDDTLLTAWSPQDIIAETDAIMRIRKLQGENEQLLKSFGKEQKSH